MEPAPTERGDKMDTELNQTLDNNENRIKVYEVDEVATLLKSSKRTITNYIKNGEMKARKVGSKWIITEENLNIFLNS